MAAKKKSNEIDLQLKKEAEMLDPKRRALLLLLGPADAGKTTVLKQMMLLHGDGFAPTFREELKAAIHKNIVKNIKTIIDHVDLLKIELDNLGNQYVNDICELHLEENELISPEMAEQTQAFLKTPDIQAIMVKKETFEIFDDNIR